MERHVCMYTMLFCLAMCECLGAHLGHLVIGTDSGEKENLDGSSLACTWPSQIFISTANPVLKQQKCLVLPLHTENMRGKEGASLPLLFLLAKRKVRKPWCQMKITLE